VEDAERDLERRVAQVGVEGGELVGRTQRLVGDRAERERGDVRGDRPLGALAGAEGAALRLVRVEPGSGEHELFYARRARPSLVAESVGVDRHLAPPEHLQPFLATSRCKSLAVRFVAEEDHAEPAARRGQQRARYREQQAGTVARLPVGGDGTAVLDAAKPLEQRVENGTRGAAADVGDEADAAGVELGGAVVQRGSDRHRAPLGARQDR